jgi:hypothetical protein
MSRPKPVTLLAVAAVAVVGAAVLVVCTTRYLGPTRSGTAVLHAKGLLLACEAYHMHPGSKEKLPATLADLVAPPFGGNGFLKNGPQDLIDPWGGQYRYAVVPDEGGEPVLYVWAEWEKDGQLQLVGAKRKLGGRPVVFGLSE